MKKKLLFVIISLKSGGAEKSLVNLLAQINPDIYDVDLLLFKQEGVFLKQVTSFTNILTTPVSLKYSYINFDVKALKSLDGIRAMITRVIGETYCRLRHIDDGKQTRWKKFFSKSIRPLKGQYDVALAYSGGETSYYVIDKVCAKRKILWVHNDFNKMDGDKNFFRTYFHQADAVVSISDKCVDILKETYPEIKDKFYMIPNLTSSSLLYKLADEFEPEEYKNKENIILSIGRLDEQKGFDMAIKAAAILQKRGINFIWYIIGEGKLQTQLEEMIRENGVCDCIKLIGIRENPYPYIKLCSIFAQTSRFEGKSMVLDEAKILGKPIVVTNYATVIDQIEDKKEGLIVQMTPEGIAQGIEDLLKDGKLRESLIDYLNSHEYGNQDEVQKYIDLIEGD